MKAHQKCFSLRDGKSRNQQNDPPKFHFSPHSQAL